MRAVTGSVSSSKRVSVSKAADILSRFAAAETGARRDVAAYLKRASAAFDELVRFHREVRDGRRRPERGSQAEEMETRKRRAGRDGNPNPREVEGNPREKPEKEIRQIRDVEEDKEVMEDGGDGNLTEVEGDCGGGVARGEDGKRHSKKKGVNDEQERSELGGRRNEKSMEVEGERRNEEKKRRREMGEEGRDGGGKKRRNLDDEEKNEGVGLDDQSERHKKRKKRRKIGME